MQSAAAMQQPAGAAPETKPWNCCLWSVLVMGILVLILGIVVAANGGFGGTIGAGVMLIIVGLLAIPAFFCKTGGTGKCAVVTFGVLAILLCIIAGILAGFTGFLGALLNAICKEYQDNKDDFYTCSVSASNENYCNGWSSSSNVHKSYTSYNGDCTRYPLAGDQTCCKGMKAAGKKACITSDVQDTCDKAKKSFIGGICSIIASLLGCVGACLGLGNCCMGYYDETPGMGMAAVPSAVVQTQAVQIQAVPVQPPPPPGTQVSQVWTEYKNAEGKPYWGDQNGNTSWEDPNVAKA